MQLPLALDRQLFLLINHLPHPPLVDGAAMILSGIGTAGMIWIFLGVVLFIREERKDHWFFLPLITSFLLAWLAIEAYVKPWFGRIRPMPNWGAQLIIDSPGSYSFPSGHATVAFALATVLSAKEPRWKWWFYLLAAAIATSRVYLGVHFPADVIAGGVLGLIIGYASVWLGREAKRAICT